MAESTVKAPVVPPRREATPEFLARAQGTMGLLDADILLYNGLLILPEDYILMDSCDPQRKNILLILTTDGGDADVTYRIARCLQRRYKRFIVYVRRWCKSAGTLLVSGANEIIMPDDGELGPLDVQLVKRDEFGERESGLAPRQALETLRDESLNSFEHYFLKLRERSGYTLSSALVSEIATAMSVELFKPIYEQLDPMRLGEIERAVQVARAYGERLGQIGRNFRTDAALDALVSSYPSHTFAIDREEAMKLFRRVRKPTEDEAWLSEFLEDEIESLSPRVQAGQVRQDRSPFAFLHDIYPELLPAEGEREEGESEEETSGDDTSEEGEVEDGRYDGAVQSRASGQDTEDPGAPHGRAEARVGTSQETVVQEGLETAGPHKGRSSGNGRAGR